MPITLGGRACVDPKDFARECADRSLPVMDWWGKCNYFSNELGPGPAFGSFLMRKADYDAMAPGQHIAYELAFSDEFGTLPVHDVRIHHARCVDPSDPGNPDSVYQVDVWDRRGYLYQRAPHMLYGSAPFAGFNLRQDTGMPHYGTYKTGTTRYTWSEMIEILWNYTFYYNSFETITGSMFPGIGFTVEGTPDHIDVSSKPQMEALDDTLTRIGCQLKWDMVANALSIVRMGGTDSNAQSVIDTLVSAGALVWTDFPGVYSFPEPNYFYMLTRTYPYDVSRTNAIMYSRFVTRQQVNSANAVYGFIVAAYDDVPSLPNHGVGTSGFINNAEIVSRLADRYADFGRIKDMKPEVKTFFGCRPELAACVGPAWTGITVFDRGGGIHTEISRRPFLEKWLAWRPATPATGGAPSVYFNSQFSTPLVSTTIAQISSAVLASQVASGGTPGIVRVYSNVSATIAVAAGGTNTTHEFSIWRLDPAGARLYKIASFIQTCFANPDYIATIPHTGVLEGGDQNGSNLTTQARYALFAQITGGSGTVSIVTAGTMNGIYMEVVRNHATGVNS